MVKILLNKIELLKLILINYMNLILIISSILYYIYNFQGFFIYMGFILLKSKMNLWKEKSYYNELNP